MGKTYRRNSEKKFKDFRNKSKPNRFKHDKPVKKWKVQLELDEEA